MGSRGFERNPISPLPQVNRLITSHDASGKAVAHSVEPGQWQSMRGSTVAMNLVYTTSTFPADLNDEADIALHEKKSSLGSQSLVTAGGSVCRIVDFAPNVEPMMHRTKSLDYGVVLEGEMDMVLDSGEVHRMKRGDVAVQRGTMHAWRNGSETEWARMLFVLLDCQPVIVGGVQIGEQLAKGQHELRASENGC